MKKKVLFLCTGNSCRSQMAEGLLRNLAGNKFEVYSAGTKPAKVNETTVAVMKEIGIDISGHRSKSVNEFIKNHFDYVITVCDSAKESCPIFPSKGILLHWPFPDPPHDQGVTEETIRQFRTVRDMIRERIKKEINQDLL